MSDTSSINAMSHMGPAESERNYKSPYDSARKGLVNSYTNRDSSSDDDEISYKKLQKHLKKTKPTGHKCCEARITIKNYWRVMFCKAPTDDDFKI
jgi:hypothetical protein